MPSPAALALGCVCTVTVAGVLRAGYPLVGIAISVRPAVLDVLLITASVDENTRAR